MTSTIKVDNIQNQCGANIINESSNTITIGASGDTVTLASGASQSGFGRTGTVDWETTKKTASFTAVNGEGYFVDSSSSAITVTLPASPSAGNIVSVSDYNGSASTNSITVARNSSNINGSAEDYNITKPKSAVTFVYVDATVGWTSVQTANTADNVNPFIVASGGTETECGDFKIHTFTGPGTFTVSKISCTAAQNTVGYLVVGGGGGGVSNQGGAGGAGGYREGRNVPIDNFTASPLVADAPTNAITLTATSYPITVGGGGSTGSCATSGANSVFSTITGAGGGAGGTRSGQGSNGGSGGGNGACAPSPQPGGSGNTPPVSPSQGNPGGKRGGAADAGGGGGGGANAAGSPGTDRPEPGTAGGAGVSSSITGSSVARAGGGGGGQGGPPNTGTTPGTGGTGGGGNGGGGPGGPGTASAGTANTGGGGGAGGNPSGNPGTSGPGGAGGSGIVVIRYKFQ
jgi:hypothetical protein